MSKVSNHASFGECNSLQGAEDSQSKNTPCSMSQQSVTDSVVCLYDATDKSNFGVYSNLKL